VQSQSITVDRQMRRYNVPAIAFVNKCDRSGANPLGVCAQLREKLGHNSYMIQHPIGLEDKLQGIIDLVSMEAIYFDGDSGEDIRREAVPAAMMDVVKEQRNKMIEGLADFDDELAMLFLEGEEISEELLWSTMRKATFTRKFTPVCCGSAYKNKGVQILLNNICKLLPSPLEMKYEAHEADDKALPGAETLISLDPSPDKPLVMLAFKLEDGRYGQLTYVRIYQGKVAKGDTIFNVNTGKKSKVGRLVQMHLSSTALWWARCVASRCVAWLMM
jgi:elongation factor G